MQFSMQFFVCFVFLAKKSVIEANLAQAPLRSIFVKYLAPLNHSKSVGIKGKAYLFQIVILFNPR